MEIMGGVGLARGAEEDAAGASEWDPTEVCMCTLQVVLSLPSVYTFREVLQCIISFIMRGFSQARGIIARCLYNIGRDTEVSE